MCSTGILTGGRRLSPIMLAEDLARPLIREILREIDLSPDQFVAELKRL